MLMVENLLRKIEENKFIKIAKIRIILYIICCHLVNDFSSDFYRVANLNLNRVFKGRIMLFFRRLNNGIGLSFVALRDKMRAGLFINGFNNQIYEGGC